MPAYKDEKRNTWYVQIRYTDWTGKKRHTCKRGFPSKSAAKKYEMEFLNSLSKNPEIVFSNLVEKYLADIENRLKPTTMENKRTLLYKRIVPYFGDLKISDIDTIAVRNWQNTMIAYRDEKGNGFAPTYLKSLNMQLSSVLNYAVAHYGLSRNPCRIAGSMGKKKADEMNIWTQEQFEQFSSYCLAPAYHLFFDILFYAGCRSGEALALTKSDFFDYKLSISKTFATVNGQKLFQTPKTEKSNRTISIPHFLYDEALQYMDDICLENPDDRVFYFTKTSAHKAFKKITEKAGLPEIRLHDLRHSHASMLIHMGRDIKEVSERLGHESVKTTWDTYSHLYPDSDRELADELDILKIQNSAENTGNTEE